MTARTEQLIRGRPRVLLAIYFLWAGFWLAVVPWTTLWDHNAVASFLPAIGAALRSPFLRGAVTGVGLVTASAGIRDLSAYLAARAEGEGGAPRQGQA